jgi:hypothetical protein
MTYSPVSFQKTGAGSSRATITSYQNGTVSQIDKGVPVSVDASGTLFPTNISDEASIHSLVGLTGMNIPSAANGLVIDNGRLEGITSSFAIGDALYVNFDGTLTNVKPDLSVLGFAHGMFVIFVGVLVKNEYNPVLKDIKLMLSVVGQL